ncbi:MAG: dipeptidase [Salinirussus sp.]
MTAKPTFDFYPGGARFVLDDLDREALEKPLANGETVADAFNALFDQQVRRLERDDTYRELLRDTYRAAGVNLVSPTMWSFGNDARAVSHSDDQTRVLGRWQARFDAVDWLRKATGPAVAREIVADDDVGVVLNTQNLGADIAGDLDAIEDLYNYGLRVTQLTYNAQNDVGTGCMEAGDAGLSRFGERVLERLNDLGIVVDCSHCSDQTRADAIQASDAPIALTHSFCRALADHPRGATDDMLESIADSDGYVGILTLPFFIAPGGDDPLEAFVEHVDHAVSILGVDNVGIGTDWGAWSLAARDDLPPAVREGVAQTYAAIGFTDGAESIGTGFDAMEDYTDWPVLLEALREAGYSAAEVRRLAGENFLSFWDRVR